MSRRVLVTGATGMLGSYVVTAALDRGWQVRALVRDPGTADWLAARGVELAQGDLRSGSSLHAATHGCDAVVHAAAVIGAGDDAAWFEAANVGGTEHVLEAAARVEARLVHVSSTAVIGPKRYRDRPTDETVPLPELPDWDVYGRTKQASEQAVLRAAHDGRLWATVVRPPVMYGQRDRQFVPRVAPFLLKGVAPLPGGGRTTLPLVHAASVADGILAALEREHARGRVYHLTEDRPVTVRDLWAGAARGLGVRVRMMPVPRPVAAAGFAGLGAALRVLGRTGLARRTGGTYRMLTRPNPFSAERARKELDWRPSVEPIDALAEAFRWWADHQRQPRRHP